jgi:hypothetical protein
VHRPQDDLPAGERPLHHGIGGRQPCAILDVHEPAARVLTGPDCHRDVALGIRGHAAMVARMPAWRIGVR